MSEKLNEQLLPSNHRFPDVGTFFNAVKQAISDDKPILLDFWTDSLEKKVCLGVNMSTGEKLLMRSTNEYTSLIMKVFSSGRDLIIVTENSIYLVDSSIRRQALK